MSTEVSGEQYYKEKLEKVRKMKESELNPYPHSFKTTISFDTFRKTYNDIEKGEHLDTKVYSMSGRVFTKRCAGNLFFYTVESDEQFLQFIASKKLSDDIANFKKVNKSVNRGDIIGVSGFVGKSKLGELSLFCTSLQILTPCMHIIPESHSGLKNKESRYRNRSLDMIVNLNVRNIFRKRSQIFKEIRNFYDSRDFMEVQTPVLWPNAGGATAKPFATMHNDMKMPVYMRIAPELFLKELVIGGLTKVYEIGPQFRNEAMDMTHNPEFYSLESYEAYADYNDLMVMTEQLLSQLVKNVNGSLLVKYDDKDIDFTPPYKKIDMMSELTKVLEVEFPKDLSTEESRLFLIKLCEDREITLPKCKTSAKLLDKLVGEYIEPQCKNPTFIINHHKEMSPLAKWHRDNEHLTERFELFVNGMELCNAYTELNDPVVQKERFEMQQKDKELGDDEVQTSNDHFIKMMEYGLPPTAGFGMGLDRLVMILTDNNSIREVLPFPIMGAEKN